MNVLSLFDGMSCGQLALKKSGIKVNAYYASEIDTHAIKTAYCNGCSKYIKNISYDKPKLYFGKHKGIPIEDYGNPEMISYLNWIVSQEDIMKKMNKKVKECIFKKINK